jgi:hypothetical protein
VAAAAAVARNSEESDDYISSEDEPVWVFFSQMFNYYNFSLYLIPSILFVFYT